MIDQAFTYVGTLINKVKDIYPRLSLDDFSVKAGVSQRLLHEYEIISRTSNMHRSSDDGNGGGEDDDDDELCYAVARSFPVIRPAIDAVSTSEPEFPKLFHRHDESASSESLSLIQQPMFMGHDPLYADWLVNDKRSSAEVQNMYRKVANWVFSQQRFFHRRDHDDDDDDDYDDDDDDSGGDGDNVDDDVGEYADFYAHGGCSGSGSAAVGCHGGIFLDEMEMIDPLDLFDDSLLTDFLLLTRSSSEKRILLREFSHYTYNMMTVKEAMKSCQDCHYLKTPNRQACFEMSEMPCENEECMSEEEQPFLTVETVLEEYACYDNEGHEIVVNDSPYRLYDSASSISNESSIRDEGEIESKDLRSNELEIVSYHYSDVIQQNVNSDDCTSVTYPTDVFDITTAVVADIISESDEHESDIWEDAKAIPHWLDFETESHLFTQPRRPFYYYRDRIKGCYRIIGVEDETVVLFSGNDDDSIFYGCQNEERNVRDISALRRSHSLGLMNSSIHKSDDAFVSKPIATGPGQVGHAERKNDSGIEDVEDSIVDDGLIEAALSAKECHDMGRVTKVIRSREPKTVTFKLESTGPLLFDYFLIVFAGFCFLCSIISFVLTVQR